MNLWGCTKAPAQAIAQEDTDMVTSIEQEPMEKPVDEPLSYPEETTPELISESPTPVISERTEPPATEEIPEPDPYLELPLPDPPVTIWPEPQPPLPETMPEPIQLRPVETPALMPLDPMDQVQQTVNRGEALDWYLADKLNMKAGLTPTGWEQPDIEVYKTKPHSYAPNAEELYPEEFRK